MMGALLLAHALLVLAEPAAAPGALEARFAAPPARPDRSGGVHRLAGGALLYVPHLYRGEPLPLLVVLHGAGHRPESALELVRDAARQRRFLVLAPKAAGRSWDLIQRGRFGPDTAALDAALKSVAARYAVDPGRVALAGFSDGASYALSLGVSNPALFGTVLAFSPGMARAATVTAGQKIFISHGRRDVVLPVTAGRGIAAALRNAGADVRYEEFEGGHEAPERIVAEAIDLFLGEGSKNPAAQGGTRRGR